MTAPKTKSSERHARPGGLIGRQAPLFIGAAILLAMIVAGSAGLDAYLYNLQIAEGEQATQNLAAIVADQTDHALQSAAIATADVIQRLTNAQIKTPIEFSAAANNAGLRTMVSNRLTEDPILDNVAIINAAGDTVAQQPYAVPADPSRARAFAAQLNGGEANRLMAASPLQSKWSSESTWQIAISQPALSDSKTFLGIVSATARLPSVETMLDKVARSRHGSISIFDRQGGIIACFPRSEMGFGGDIVNTRFYREYIATQHDGVMHQKSAVDGVDRMFASANSSQFPITAAVAIDMDDVLAGWLRQATLLGLGAAAVMLTIIIGALRLAMRTEQLAAARQRDAMRAQADIEYRRFNNAMDNIVQGVAIYDKNNALTACNKRFAEIYALPQKLIAPGVNQRQILAHGGATTFGTTKSGPFSEEDGGVLTINELADGRIIAQRRKKLADGGSVSTHEDITVRHRAEAKIEQMASSDAVTGLANRFAFRQRLEQCIAEVQRKIGKFAVFYLDLDRFKAVNDTLGHPTGDALLKEVALRIKTAVRQSDTVARLGGDEFAVIQRVSATARDATKLAERLIESISKPYVIGGNTIEIGVSIGISTTPEDSIDPDELIRNADIALYHSKSDGGVFNFFKTAMNEQVRQRHSLEKDLKIALAEGQFELHYQPVVSASDRRVKSFEALLRWNHPERGRVSPLAFIPLAEETGLITPIGAWVIEEACRQAARWPANIKVAVNISAIQFKSPDLLPTITGAIKAAGITGSRLIAEVTESVMIKDAEQAISVLHALRKLGVVIAMDDFGTGYSSLSYLRRFPFDKIKIDKSFIDEIGQRDDSAAIVRAAASLAKALGMETVAEGVETEAQFALVGAEGCSEVQGYLISKPLPAADVFTFLDVSPIETVNPSNVLAMPKRSAVDHERGAINHVAPNAVAQAAALAKPIRTALA